MRSSRIARWGMLALATAGAAFAQGGPSTPHPILFVTQVPVGGFGTATAVFGNQQPSASQAPRGGDLVIRYSNGTLRFLTQEAGYGSSGLQGANAIAVREPCVHWSGSKALFSMVVGAPTQQYQVDSYVWQIFEVTGLGENDTATIRHVAGQPVDFDNVSPIYATDGRILFISDRPPSGAAHHFPQLDEYESSATVAAIYGLDESTATVTLLEHAPSGIFSLSLDSAGRVIFTKWDHLQRDQQGDAPATAANYEAFTWASEAADAPTTTSLADAEVFPEPRSLNDPTYDPVLALHPFNHFLPWELNEDGTAEETLNHIGRHELGGSYSDGSFVGDPNLTYYVPPNLHANQLSIAGSAGLFHLREDPTMPGDFLTTYAQEFGTASGGTLMRITGAAGVNPDDMVLTAITPTGNDAIVPDQTGYFRNPLPLADGSIVAAHTPAAGQATNLGTTAAPNWSYAFRLKTVVPAGAFWAAGSTLTAGIQKSISWWTPDVLATHTGPLWELDPVEVAPRAIPLPRTSDLPAIEAGVFAAAAVDVDAFRTFLRDHELALIVSRNVTQRDRADRHQPFNLQVPGGVSSIGAPGTIYDVAFLQVFQADALRGYGGPDDPRPGRRLLARPMHTAGVSHDPGAPSGGVAVAADGSFAALVPARRALTWQLTDPDGEGVVRERNWISFQAGEIRVCGSCHGINTASQTGDTEPTNPPAALHALLAAWKAGGGQADQTCTSGLAITRARLRVKGTPARVVLRGSTTMPAGTIDPATHGMKVMIGSLVSAAIPGSGAWTTKDPGSHWAFRDPTGQFGGVTQIDVHATTKDDATVVVFTVRAGVSAPRPEAGPLTVSVWFGEDPACATGAWSGPNGSRPRCALKRSKLVCR